MPDAFHWTDPDATWVLDHDGHGAPAVWDHPISHFEPLDGARDEVRMAQVKCVTVLNMAFSELQDVLERPDATINRALITLYGLAFALGLNLCGNSTLTTKARELGCTKAILSRRATSFCEATGLVPSFYMKSASSRKRYAERRREVVIAKNGNGANGSNGTTHCAK